MLRFIVSETGVIPNHSNIYSNGYQILAKTDIEFLPFSSTTINTGLILKCVKSDFIHVVIDNTYQNLLNVDNAIIEDPINTPHDIIIKNVTNNNITIHKDSVLCHFYSNNKAYLYNTVLQDNIIKNKQYEKQSEQPIHNSNIVSDNNIISHEIIKPEVVEEVKPEVVEVVKEVKPEVIEEVKPEVVEEVKPEVVEEVKPEVVEEVKPEVVEEVKPEVVEEVKPEVVEEVKTEVVEEVKPEVVEEVKYVVIENENHLDIEEVKNNVQNNNIDNYSNLDIHDIQNIHNEVNSSQSAQNDANTIKRKYIRKKKTIINSPSV
jgi:hypothetical protein